MKKSIKTIIATTVMTFAFAFTALASVYSTRWETQSDGNWKYKLDAGGYATTAWVQDEVDHNWYLLGDNGIMRSGIFESYGKYYLLSEVHDGHFGHLVKNGEVYHGITIQADTSADYEGALSQESINALKSLGYKFDSVTSVTGTQHVSNGQVTLSSSNNSNTINNTQSQSQSKAEEFAEKGWSLTNEDGVGWQADGTFNWGDGGASKHLTAGGTLSQESVENFLKNR